MLDVLERQQRLTSNQWKIIAAAILGDMLDFFDFFLIGYVLAFIVGAWKLSFMESGAILLAAGIGAIPGAFSGGGWPTGSAAAECLSPPCSISRSRPG